MAERYELRFSGAGGQGLITAGIILAEAASIIEANTRYNPRATALKHAAALPNQKLSFLMNQSITRKRPLSMPAWL